VFAELAAATGGRSFFARDPAALATAMKQIAKELRFQYLLGYAPSRERAADAVWHGIDVTVLRPGAKVRARDGYSSR
jgi:VWFA-related protein